MLKEQNNKKKDYCNEVFQKKKSADGKSYRVQQKLTQWINLSFLHALKCLQCNSTGGDYVLFQIKSMI